MTDDRPRDSSSSVSQTKLPTTDGNLYERIRRRVESIGGADDLILPPREPGREPPRFDALDQTIAEARKAFADMPPDEAEALIDEAVTAVRKECIPVTTATEIDVLEAQGRFDSLIDQVERGAEFIITRQGKAVARLLPAWQGADETRDNSSYDLGMKHTDFRVGATFRSGGRRWRCTDIGTRVITAIALDHDDDPSWYNGPPYAVAEVSFDEDDIEGCSPEAEPDEETPSGAPDDNLAEAIRRRFAPFGGVDDLILPPRQPVPDPPDFADILSDEPETPAEDSGSTEDKARQIAQARALREQARAGGLRFEAYLPPTLADWLLDHIERGTFRDPDEATFVMLGEQRELEPHADLRREFFKRRIQSAIDDPRPSIPAEEVFQRLRESLKEPQPEPAVWRKLP